MTKKKGLFEMLTAAMEAANQAAAPQTKKIKVGRVSRAMVERVRAIDERHDKQHDELSEKIDAYKDKIATEAAAKMKAFIDQVEAEHKPDCRKAREDMAAAWDEIHDELGLPESERAINYQLNAITGDITKEVPLQETEPESEKIFH